MPGSSRILLPVVVSFYCHVQVSIQRPRLASPLRRQVPTSASNNIIHHHQSHPRHPRHKKQHSSCVCLLRNSTVSLCIHFPLLIRHTHRSPPYRCECGVRASPIRLKTDKRRKRLPDSGLQSSFFPRPPSKLSLATHARAGPPAHSSSETWTNRVRCINLIQPCLFWLPVQVIARHLVMSRIHDRLMPRFHLNFIAIHLACP